MKWACDSCGELHNEQFDSCWKCNTARDGTVLSVPSVESSNLNEGTHLDMEELPCSTTPEIPGRKIVEANGIVCGEAIMGANILRDMTAGITDLVGRRSGVYESKLREGRKIALLEMMKEAVALGCNAVVGVHVGYETVGQSMLMVCASGTAVTLYDESENASPDVLG